MNTAKAVFFLKLEIPKDNWSIIVPPKDKTSLVQAFLTSCIPSQKTS